MNDEILKNKNQVTLKDALWVTAGSLLYLFLSVLLIGFKTDQLFLIGLFNVLYYSSLGTRKFILGFLIFIVFWIIFDFMKVIPNYKINPVHIQDVYLREKSLFGINDNNVVLTPNEYADKHSTTFLDVLAGSFYINWVPIPLLFAFYLFRKNKPAFLQFALSFLFVNLIGFVVYYLYPAAPPWYVKEYGFQLQMNIPGHTGALSRFDDFFGIHVFSSIYAKNSNVFAAMPSLHSAYPVIVFYYGLKNRLGLINIFFAIFMMGIWFAAVYTGHHYIQDVLAGITCAATGLFLFQKVLMKTNWFNRFIDNYTKRIS